jgi:hypothetical protein
MKHGLFPFTVKGSEKKKYIDSLEQADKGYPQLLVDFFCEVEKRNIEEVLNLKLELSTTKSTFDEVANVFSQKIEKWKSGIQLDRIKRIDDNRTKIFEFSSESLNHTIEELHKKISKEHVGIYEQKSFPDSKNYFWFTHQIVDYAKMHNYFFNRTQPRGWFKVAFVLSEDRQYQLVISIHHYGYDDSTIAVGAFLEYIESGNHNKNASKKQIAPNRNGKNNNLITSLPLDIKPHIISLEADIEELELNLKSFLQDTVTIALGQIAREIS